ncbi:MAG: hypothetical protein ACLUDU_13655 [Butyricimonas faecihominis]
MIVRKSNKPMIPVSVVICTNSLKAVSGASATSSSPAGRSVAEK